MANESFIDSIRELEILKENLNAESCTGGKPLSGFGEPKFIPSLDYNLQQSTTFSTYGYLYVRVPENIFIEDCYKIPEESYFKMTPAEAAVRFSENIQLGIDDLLPKVNIKRLRSDLDKGSSNILDVSKASLTVKDGPDEDILASETPKIILNDTMFNDIQMKQLIKGGYMPMVVRKMHGLGSKIKLVRCPVQPSPRIFVVEEYKTRSFLGRYGAGKTLRTLSLLPGEKTTITIKTYKNSTSTRTHSENLLDSFSQNSVDELESLIEEENNTSKDRNISVGIGGSFSEVLLGVLNVNADFSASTTSNVRAMKRAFSKHVEQSNASRNIEVNTTTSDTRNEGEEYTTVRELENINKSRVLNFVFRQMLQEYVSVTFLANIRIVYTNGYPESTRIVDYEDLDMLLRDIIDENNITNVRTAIDSMCQSIKDYEGRDHDFIREYIINNGQSSITPIDGAEAVEIPGIILDVQRNTLQTDSVIADALLGHGEALDCFNQRAQNSVAVGEYLKDLEHLQKLELVRSITDEHLRAEVIKSLYGTTVPQMQIVSGNNTTQQ